MMLGSVMDDAGYSHLDTRPRRYSARSLYDRHWSEDPGAYEQAMLAGIALLNAARPGSKSNAPPPVHRPTMTSGSYAIVNQMIRAVRTGSVNHPFAKAAPTIRSLLGPVARRLFYVRDATRTRIRPGSITATPSPQISESDSMAIADGVLHLVNSSPRTPSCEEIAGVILNRLHSLARTGPKS
jgi:hypothetical protein